MTTRAQFMFMLIKNPAILSPTIDASALARIALKARLLQEFFLAGVGRSFQELLKLD